ncbi:hypothetical protein Pan44_43290 [Caulifigura coniformis]|uniref:Uncharacterized protein n=1 Tax=Caulifigura coniformis TaxID=2527983 RepID=A0A517SJK5_9PLAN|nr:hypothetical protein [Caulifigura coniformis]QDT56276.1 hypothetical protein Pan44_43290 [Caulifigura coniformis]
MTRKRDIDDHLPNLKHKDQTVPAKFKPGFLSALDGRTDLAKALRANYEELVADLGGPDELGRVKRALVERFVWLEAILQTIEHELVSGEIDRNEALGRWVQAVNSLSGLAKCLGIEKKLGNAPWLQPAKATAEAKA